MGDSPSFGYSNLLIPLHFGRVRVPSAPPVKLLKCLTFLQLSRPHPSASDRPVTKFGDGRGYEGSPSSSGFKPDGSAAVDWLIDSTSASVAPSIQVPYLSYMTCTLWPCCREHHSGFLPIMRCQLTHEWRAL
jgi:hypothetical protein